jgi:hypothetical protein
VAVLLIACTPPGARSGGLADNLSTLLRVYSSGHQNDRNSLNSEHLDVLGNKADERQQMTAQRYRTQGSGPANRTVMGLTMPFPAARLVADMSPDCLVDYFIWRRIAGSTRGGSGTCCSARAASQATRETTSTFAVKRT